METRAPKRRPFFARPLRYRLVAFGFAGLTGAIVTFAAPAWLHGTTRAVAAYDCGAIVLLGVYWIFAMQSDPQFTSARASIGDPPRNAVLGVAYAFGIAAVAIGWTLIHTMFTLRYAHLFYYEDPDDNDAAGGLIFPGTTEPNDFDFAYLWFGIGTTFQVRLPIAAFGAWSSFTASSRSSTTTRFWPCSSTSSRAYCIE